MVVGCADDAASDLTAVTHHELGGWLLVAICAVCCLCNTETTFEVMWGAVKYMCLGLC